METGNYGFVIKSHWFRAQRLITMKIYLHLPGVLGVGHVKYTVLLVSCPKSSQYFFCLSEILQFSELYNFFGNCTLLVVPLLLLKLSSIYFCLPPNNHNQCYDLALIGPSKHLKDLVISWLVVWSWGADISRFTLNGMYVGKEEGPGKSVVPLKNWCCCFSLISFDSWLPC